MGIQMQRHDRPFSDRQRNWMQVHIQWWSGKWMMIRPIYRQWNQLCLEWKPIEPSANDLLDKHSTDNLHIDWQKNYCWRIKWKKNDLKQCLEHNIINQSEMRLNKENKTHYSEIFATLKMRWNSRLFITPDVRQSFEATPKKLVSKHYVMSNNNVTNDYENQNYKLMTSITRWRTFNLRNRSLPVFSLISQNTL